MTKKDCPLGEDCDLTLAWMKGAEDARDKAKARIEALEAELHLMKTSGVAEVAVRNPSVMEYMKHWEGRAEAAEAKLAKAVKVLVLCRDMFDEVAHPSDPMSVLLNTTLAELEGDKP